MSQQQTKHQNNFLFFSDFHWPPLRFGWKRKTAINAITAPVAVDEKIASISNEELQAPSTSADESVKPSDPIIKPSRKAPKEGKKHSGSAMMDIGVWNPDAIGDKNQPSGIVSTSLFFNLFLYLTLFSLSLK